VEWRLRYHVRVRRAVGLALVIGSAAGCQPTDGYAVWIEVDADRAWVGVWQQGDTCCPDWYPRHLDGESSDTTPLGCMACDPCVDAVRVAGRTATPPGDGGMVYLEHGHASGETVLVEVAGCQGPAQVLVTVPPPRAPEPLAVEQRADSLSLQWTGDGGAALACGGVSAVFSDIWSCGPDDGELSFPYGFFTHAWLHRLWRATSVAHAEVPLRVLAWDAEPSTATR